MSVLYTLLFVANQFVYVKIYRFYLEKVVLLGSKRHCISPAALLYGPYVHTRGSRNPVFFAVIL
ncbi:hypothetical protein FLA4_03080 [Candidatus Rickettsia kotlanii]|nr:hypothetical protein FLA4_03080 [Candidatus Rickettsia kotlanii]BDU61140.1 hypothetical protein HM2_03080 [Candidatus Rickettsia kotlanii]